MLPRYVDIRNPFAIRKSLYNFFQSHIETFLKPARQDVRC